MRSSSHPQPGPKTRTPHGPLREGGISTCNGPCRRVQTVPEFPELPFGDPRRLSFLTLDLAILVRVQVSQPFFSRARKRQLRVLRLLCREHANPLLIPELPKPDRRTQIVHASEVSESVPGNYETAILRCAAQLDSATQPDYGGDKDDRRAANRIASDSIDTVRITRMQSMS